jgi:hypothetical protein
MELTPQSPRVSEYSYSDIPHTVAVYLLVELPPRVQLLPKCLLGYLSMPGRNLHPPGGTSCKAQCLLTENKYTA